MALTEPVPGKTKQRKRKTPQPITESDDDFDEAEVRKMVEGFRCKVPGLYWFTATIEKDWMVDVDMVQCDIL